MQTSQKETPKSEIVLNIGENSYKLKFPDTGQLIDLEQAKSRLNPPRNQTTSAIWAYNLAIAIETFSILIPDLQKDMNVKDFYKLSAQESSELVKVYVKVFKPWYDAWMEIISDIFDDAENG